MEVLHKIHEQLLKATKVGFLRYLHAQINWKNRLISIVGARGVGKTTLMLQYIKLNKQKDQMLYASVEHLYFSNATLLDFADEFCNSGGKVLLLDEIHQYKNWAREIKVIYDSYPELQIIVSGSSILEINQGNADLSRRVISYELKGMSFREYLNFTQKKKYNAIPLDKIHAKAKIDIDIPLKHFKDYLKQGYYPFLKEDQYHIRLQGIVNKIIDIDLVRFMDLKPHTAHKLKRLLSLVAQNVPFKPNMAKLSNLTEISRRLLPEYFNYMERAGLIKMYHTHGKSIRTLGKADKLYLNNTNLSYAISLTPDIGSIRETFFISQLSVLFDITLPPKGDFLINEITYEVGGKNKDNKQIKGVEHSYLVKDDIEVGYSNIIPLWHFGFLY